MKLAHIIYVFHEMKLLFLITNRSFVFNSCHFYILHGNNAELTETEKYDVGDYFFRKFNN